MSWVLWAIILLLQNAAFVANSRARNGASLYYHGITNLCSNGVWIISQFFAVDKISQALKTSDWGLATIIFAFYITMNFVGGLTTHHLLLKRGL